MSISNWPLADNRASPNWSGRTQRTSNWGGAWQDDSYRIPALAWVGVVGFLAVMGVFAFVGAGVLG